MGVCIRELQTEDLAGISALIARVFDRSAPEDGAERLHWLLYDNPDARPEVAKGWVLEDSGAPVGFLANVARRMSVSGRDALAGCTAKYVVLPSHRFHGLLLAKTFFSQQGVDLLFCSTGSESSAPVLKRFGAAEIAGGDEAAMFVLRGGPVIGELMRRRGYQGPLARLVSGGAGAALTLVERVRCSAPACPADIRVEPLPRFDQRLDDLWMRCEGGYGITSRRDARRMQWLFFDGPSSRPATQIRGAFRGESLEGYIVCQDRGQTRDVRRREVMDVFMRPDDADTFAALIARALADAEADGMDTLEFRNLPRPLMDRLVGWGARRRLLDVNPFLVKGLNPEFSLPADQATAWYLTPSDGDGAGW